MKDHHDPLLVLRHCVVRVFLPLAFASFLFAGLGFVSAFLFPSNGRALWEVLAGTIFQVAFYHKVDALLSGRGQRRLIGPITFAPDDVLPECCFWFLIIFPSFLVAFLLALARASFIPRMLCFFFLHGVGILGIQQTIFQPSMTLQLRLPQID